LNTWASWFGLVVLVLGVAAGITVPLVFHVSHWVTAVIIMGAGLLVVAEGSYLSSRRRE
jgi:putative Mn2+ efflux pump MntP